jgi:hypothetical protein
LSGYSHSTGNEAAKKNRELIKYNHYSMYKLFHDIAHWRTGWLLDLAPFADKINLLTYEKFTKNPKSHLDFIYSIAKEDNDNKMNWNTESDYIKISDSKDEEILEQINNDSCLISMINNQIKIEEVLAGKNYSLYENLSLDI